jgi:hypothetical protein
VENYFAKKKKRENGGSNESLGLVFEAGNHESNNTCFRLRSIEVEFFFALAPAHKECRIFPIVSTVTQ